MAEMFARDVKTACRLLLVLLALAGGCASARPAASAGSDEALQYWHESRREPRPLQIHHLRLDLRSPGYELIAVIADDPDGQGPAEAALTPPLELVRRSGVIAAVNTNPWGATTRPAKSGWVAGMAVDIHGWAKSESRQASAPNSAYWSFWMDERGRPRIGNPDRSRPARMAIGGFGALLRDGAVVAKRDAVLHPRTALGFDASGRFLWLVVVDGRQSGYSEGMSLVELARMMKELGCADAINLDGGGSSVMIVGWKGDEPKVVNRPSDRGTRPIPVMLGIRSIQN